MRHPADPGSAGLALPQDPPRRPAARPERRELDHRMANSLQLAMDLLMFEQVRVEDPVAREALAATVARISAVAQLHRCLCDNDLQTGVDLQLFLAEICDLISRSTGLACSLDAEPILLPASTAQQLAIAINELAMNAAKHAYHGRTPGGATGALHVEAHRRGDRLRLVVSDHGTGLGADFRVGEAHGLGMEILQAVVRQVRGVLEARDDHGARFTITLPLPADMAPISRSFAPPV